MLSTGEGPLRDCEASIFAKVLSSSTYKRQTSGNFSYRTFKTKVSLKMTTDNNDTENSMRRTEYILSFMADSNENK